MLATERIQSLIRDSKAIKVLKDQLLPVSSTSCFLQLEEISSVTVVEETNNDIVPVAIGIFNHCSPNQVYCSIATLDGKYAANFVNIEQIENVDLGLKGADPDRHTCFKITEVRPTEPDLSGLPQYFSAFGKREVRPLHQCIIDQLIEQTVRHTNMDMKRNLTVDLYAEEAVPDAELPAKLWRDYDGFIVGDKHRFAEVEIENLFTDYDSDVAIMNREEYLEWLLRLDGVLGTVALNNEMRPVGYILSRDNHIVQCYAETPEIAQLIFFDFIIDRFSQLLHEHLSKMSSDVIAMFLRYNDDWLGRKISMEARTSKPIRRFHSRVVPANIKWNKTFVLNIGVHIY